MKQGLWAGALAMMMLEPGAQQAQSTLPAAPAPQQQTIPDGPRPQAAFPGAESVVPGSGTTSTSGRGAAAPAPAGTDEQTAPGTPLPAQAGNGNQGNGNQDEGTPPELPAAGQGAQAFTLTVRANFVEVPFTVKDSKGRLVPGLTWRDVHIYENGLRQRMSVFTVDPFPLSVALVIDQSVTFDTMAKINNSLEALQGAFSPYDEVAVFTFNNGPRMQTDFTAAQGARLSAVLERSKTAGREGAMMYTSGPLSQNVNINSGAQSNVMPLVNTSHGTSQSNTLNVPKELHTLNDAILAAAQATTKAARGRRKLIYVISDGKEYGSTAKYKDVVKYLQTNNIAVYATLVGDSSVPGLGFLDRIHLPMTMRDDILPLYASATGGQVDPEFRTRGIENSFAKITEEVRTQYTVGYYTHEPFIDGKYRSIEVRVLRPGLDVIAKKGYYPTASSASAGVVQSK